MSAHQIHVKMSIATEVKIIWTFLQQCCQFVPPDFYEVSAYLTVCQSSYLGSCLLCTIMLSVYKEQGYPYNSDSLTSFAIVPLF